MSGDFNSPKFLNFNLGIRIIDQRNCLILLWAILNMNIKCNCHVHSPKIYTTLELVSLNSPFQSCLPFSRHFHRGSWRLTIVGNQTKNRFRDVPHTIIKETSNTTTPELNHRSLNMVNYSKSWFSANCEFVYYETWISADIFQTTLCKSF